MLSSGHQEFENKRVFNSTIKATKPKSWRFHSWFPCLVSFLRNSWFKSCLFLIFKAPLQNLSMRIVVKGDNSRFNRYRSLGATFREAHSFVTITARLRLREVSGFPQHVIYCLITRPVVFQTISSNGNPYKYCSQITNV